jgi:zinc protease
MIHYEHFQLENGLNVYVHEDHTTPIAVLNLLYGVGSRDEDENKTGFAHLFEHLMFGGSVNIPIFDEPLQRAGGENNAFTSPDITNYYVTIPSKNIETAFWLESDRMLSLAFSEESLEVQRKVVIEEFKQRYLNQPYGDVWLKMNPLAYTQHPYKWCTIGKDISHIENATMDDVKAFFSKYYVPNNAHLVVAGDVTLAQVKRLCKKWFASIPKGAVPPRNLPKEPRQTEARLLEVEADVPASILYKVYQMCNRTSLQYHPTDLLSDLLGRSKSSRLYTKLVQQKQLFSSMNASVTGAIDDGLLVVSGRLNKGVNMKEADEAVSEIIEEFRHHAPDEHELQKVKNQAESTLIFSEMELLNRAMGLAYAAFAGDVDLINQESARIQAVTPAHIQTVAYDVLRANNCSTMYYKSKQN